MSRDSAYNAVSAIRATGLKTLAKTSVRFIAPDETNRVSW
jgi:hypothetical protein